MSVFHRTTRPAICAIGGLLLVGALPALAGKATVVSSEGQTMVFEYAGDDFMRMGQTADNYMLVRDNNLYVVGNQDGQVMVFDASSMMRGFSGMLKQAAPSTTTNEFVSLEKTGRRESIAGITGEVYLLTVIEDGKQRTDEAVMSDDPRAIEFRDALFVMARAATAALDDDGASKNSKELKARLEETGMGILRVGQDLKVTAISGEQIAAARFALPAEPMDMQGLGAMMGSMGESMPRDDSSSDGKKSGGFFSGIAGALSGKADRQTDRAADKVDDKVDEKTDDAVDNVLDKAFGKLFGR
jgi:hypothetical protein